MTDTNARAALAARQERIELRKWAGFDASERVMGIGTGTPLSRLARALTGSHLSRNKVQRWKNSARATPATAATGHIPFPGSRTVAEVMAEAREEQVRRAIRRGLGR